MTAQIEDNDDDVQSVVVVQGRHYSTGKPTQLTSVNGIITELEEIPSCPDNQWLAPSLVDIQVNGYAGVDFQSNVDQLHVDDLLLAARSLRRDGCSRWMMALITDEWGGMMERLAHLKRLRDSSETLRRAILGWHIEGPFLSEVPGYCGAHDASAMIDPTVSAIEELKSICQDDPVLLTLAPERRGSELAIRRASELGMSISLGHTAASSCDIAMAIRAGASGFTHFGNACPQLLDRHDNILFRVLDSELSHIGLIPDTMHVKPPLFRLVHRSCSEFCGKKKNVYYTTDAMSAAGVNEEETGSKRLYTLGNRLALEVVDGVARLPGGTHFAGSALRPIVGVRRAAEMMGSMSWQDVWDGFSGRPASVVVAGKRREEGVVEDVGDIDPLGRICVGGRAQDVVVVSDAGKVLRWAA